MAMYTFTLWHQLPMPPRYAECVEALLVRYPSLEVREFASQTTDPRMTAELVRLQILRDTAGAVLYVDPDNLPGADTWTGEGVDRCAAINCRGGLRDTSVLYKPAGCETEVQAALDAGGTRTVLYYRYVQGWLGVRGYPDNRYFQHFNLSRVMEGEKQH